MKIKIFIALCYPLSLLSVSPAPIFEIQGIEDNTTGYYKPDNREGSLTNKTTGEKTFFNNVEEVIIYKNKPEIPPTNLNGRTYFAKTKEKNHSGTIECYMLYGIQTEQPTFRITNNDLNGQFLNLSKMAYLENYDATKYYFYTDVIQLDADTPQDLPKGKDYIFIANVEIAKKNYKLYGFQITFTPDQQSEFKINPLEQRTDIQGVSTDRHTDNAVVNPNAKGYYYPKQMVAYINNEQNIIWYTDVTILPKGIHHPAYTRFATLKNNYYWGRNWTRAQGWKQTQPEQSEQSSATPLVQALELASLLPKQEMIFFETSQKDAVQYYPATKTATVTKNDGTTIKYFDVFETSFDKINHPSLNPIKDDVVIIGFFRSKHCSEEEIKKMADYCPIRYLCGKLQTS